MADPSRARERRTGRRRALVGVSVVVLALLIGGAAAWAADGSSNAGYRMTRVVRASVGQSLTVVGTVAPVNDASASFQVAGQVATVTATVGQQVTAGQTLGTLATTALSESLSSAQSTVNADDAKLTEDEDSEAAAATTTTTTTPASTTTTTAPTHSGTGGTGSSGGTATITADQNTLTTDQAKTSADQQKEAADLAQAESTCGTATTPPSSTTTTTTTPANAAACSADLQQASNDQQQVSADQRQVSKDEATLAQALGDGSSTSGNPTSSSGPAPGSTSTTSTTVATTTPTTSTVSGTGNTGRGDDDAAAGVGAGTGAGTPTSSEGATSDSPEEIASDQAAIDTAQANLIEAQQALAEATLSSPITGTIASVGVTVGDTVSADSSTAVIVIIGTQSFEVSGTLTSSQVSSVKVAQTADVEVDGVSAGITGTVSQVGPVQSGTSGYSYPVVVALPTTTQGLFSGSTANVTIATGQVTNVVAVPTSAVITAGTSSYVLTLSGGTLGRTVIKVGMVGSTYTQVLSGLKVGDAVVLADLAEAVPSSNTATLGGFGGGGGFGGAGGFTGGTGRFTRTVVGGGGLGG